jgi:hypothetical protein
MLPARGKAIPSYMDVAVNNDASEASDGADDAQARPSAAGARQAPTRGAAAAGPTGVRETHGARSRLSSEPKPKRAAVATAATAQHPPAAPASEAAKPRPAHSYTLRPRGPVPAPIKPSEHLIHTAAPAAAATTAAAATAAASSVAAAAVPAAKRTPATAAPIGRCPLPRERDRRRARQRADARVAKRTFGKLRCPQCGKAPPHATYEHQNPTCDCCGTRLGCDRCSETHASKCHDCGAWYCEDSCERKWVVYGACVARPIAWSCVSDVVAQPSTAAAGTTTTKTAAPTMRMRTSTTIGAEKIIGTEETIKSACAIVRVADTCSASTPTWTKGSAAVETSMFRPCASPRDLERLTLMTTNGTRCQTTRTRERSVTMTTVHSETTRRPLCATAALRGRVAVRVVRTSVSGAVHARRCYPASNATCSLHAGAALKACGGIARSAWRRAIW